jgi:hypothetical protein
VGKPIAVDFGVYALGSRKASAMTYYRCEMPLKALYKRGLANTYLDDDMDRREIAAQSLSAADIGIFWNPPVNEGGMATAQNFANMRPVSKDGALLIPPAYILDMDDAIEYTGPMNPAYAVYGIRNWKGELLEPGDTIMLPGANGAERPFWVDKKSYKGDVVWDIERNRANLEQHYELARMARGVVVSTEPLAELYRTNGCKNVYTHPNSIYLDDHFFPNLAPHDGVRIFWQGGDAHYMDWLPIREALGPIFREFPQAKLVIWGQAFPWITREIAPEQLEVHGWNDYNAYKMKRACMDVDINLCPLEPSVFNECKSAIKWYEASIGPRPEATLAANFGPYKEIQDGITGLLYNNAQEFTEKLRALIRNSILRQTLADHAREWVLQNRLAENTIIGYYDFMQEIKRGQRLEALKL